TMEQRQHGEQFRMLDSALAARDPIAPNRPRLLVVSLALAAALAAGAMMLAEYLDTSFHSTDDVRAFTTVPVVTSIPLIVSDADRWRRTRRLGFGAAATIATVMVTVTALRYAVTDN